jgi:hypothetical protein
MKRAFIIIGWTIAFPVVAWLFAYFVFPLLMRAGLESLSSSTQITVSMIWLGLFFCLPMIGLVLGLLGRLPGTKKSKS